MLPGPPSPTVGEGRITSAAGVGVAAGQVAVGVGLVQSAWDKKQPAGTSPPVSPVKPMSRAMSVRMPGSSGRKTTPDQDL